MNKLIITLILTAIVSIPHQASAAVAVADPNVIDWRGTPTAFITSLYWGILGRAPDREGMRGYVRSINAKPSSCIRAFNSIVNSPEHKNTSHYKGKREYAVFYRSQGNNWEYAVTKRPNGWYSKTSYMTFREAAARRDYFKAFHSANHNRGSSSSKSTYRSKPTCRVNESFSSKNR